MAVKKKAPAKVDKRKRVWSKEERTLVKWMAVAGRTQAEICKHFGCSLKILERDMRTELDWAYNVIHSQVVGALYKNAIRGNVQAQIFWVKTRLGWKETTTQEIVGGNIVLNIGAKKIED